MKKNQIKFVGVCAAALLTVGALTPVTATVLGETNVAYAADPTQNTFKGNYLFLTSNTVKVSDLASGGDLETKLNAVVNTANVATQPIAGNKLYELIFDYKKLAGTDLQTQIVGNIGLDFEKNAVPKVVIQTTYLPGTVYDPDGPNKSFDVTVTAIDPVTNKVIKTLVSTITVVKESVQNYEATAPNITVAVDDKFDPAQGLVVVNKKNGRELTYVDETVASNPTALKELGLKTGQYYTIKAAESTDLKATLADKDVAGEFVVASAPTTTSLTELAYTKYGKGNTYNQTVSITIPGVDTQIVRSRNITVQDPTDVIAENVFRAYNKNDGDHLFTTSQSEFNQVVSLGWGDEGVAWVAQTNGAKGGYEVYRVYNPNTGEHFYTASKAEYINLGNAGWDQEGVGFFSAAQKGNTAVYRAFNPNAKGPGSHMFTTSKVEYDNMVKAGWTGENVAFYGLAQD